MSIFLAAMKIKKTRSGRIREKEMVSENEVGE